MSIRASALVALFAAFAVVPAAVGAEPSAPGPAITATPGLKNVELTGTGFKPAERVALRLTYEDPSGAPAVAEWTFVADQDGAFSASEPISLDVAMGFSIEARGDLGSEAGFAAIAGGLPASDAAPVDPSGRTQNGRFDLALVILAGLGAALTVAARGRRRAQKHY
jgi:hypothetical protein